MPQQRNRIANILLCILVVYAALTAAMTYLIMLSSPIESDWVMAMAHHQPPQSLPEVSEETMQLQRGLLSLLSTDGIRAAVRRNSFPLDDVVETYVHLLRLTLRDRWCLPPPNAQEYREIVVQEPSPVTKKTRGIQRDRLNEIILASVRFRNMAGIGMCNASLATWLGSSEPWVAWRYRLRDDDLAHALGQSMLIHRCLAVERPLLYFLIACLNHALREALSGFSARLDAVPAPAASRPALSSGHRRVACPP